MPLVPISKQFNEYSKDHTKIVFQDNKWNFSEICVTDMSNEIWLYYDCIGVEIDNGLRQFQHDNSIQDDVER